MVEQVGIATTEKGVEMAHELRQVFDRVRSGDEDAARECYGRYFSRLVALARSRLSEKLSQKIDPDDVVQSAFRSFFVRARDGQFEIGEGSDLWALLASITRHKLLKQAEHFRQQKRNLDRDQPLTTPAIEGDARLSAPEPSPQEAAMLADELEHLMQQQAPLQRRMLELRLQGQPIAEIATAVERSERSVRRFLGAFRDDLERRFSSLRAE